MTLAEQLEASIAYVIARKAAAANPAAALHAIPAAAAPARHARSLPNACYYQPAAAELVDPPPLRPRDESRIATPSERDARALSAEGRARLLRFFQGRYSRRLGRVVRPA